MDTEVLPVDAIAPQAAPIARAAEVLRGGGVVAFPTETVYGLGANALDAKAVERIFTAKGRPATNPVIVHVRDIAEARTLAADWPDMAQQLAERFWPGPLTLVVRKRALVPDVTTAGGPTVALRWPSHAVAQALMRAADVPLAAPSANRSTRISATTAEHVRQALSGRIDLILDGGPTPGGLESTVLDVTCSPPRLLRPGLHGVSELEALLGESVAIQNFVVDESQPMASPGMMTRHYAPSVPLECIDGLGVERIGELAAAGVRVGWLTCGPVVASVPAGATHVALPTDVAGYSAGLYAALHALEAAGVQRIIVSRPRSSDDWGAVHDRLRRASA